MKSLRTSFLLLVVTGAVSWAQSTNPIQRVVLDSMAVVRIPVAMDRLTTVRLPSPPSDVESARVGTEPHPEALFLLSIQPGSPSFSLRALVPNTNTTLNVAWKGQTYVLDLFESRQPWLSVTFEAPQEASPRAASGASRGMPPARLLGLLDTAKAYALLRQQHPTAVAGTEVVRPDTLRDYGDYTIRTEEVFRFDAEDTLVFRIAISNKTSADLQFVPESLMVRVGTRIYYQSITDAAGKVAPHSSTPVYFAVTGSPDGSRNALSPKNDFMILLQRVEAVTTLPVAARSSQTVIPAFRSTLPTDLPAVERYRQEPAVVNARTSPPATARVTPPRVAPRRIPLDNQNAFPKPLSPPAPAPVQVLPPRPADEILTPVGRQPFAYQSYRPFSTGSEWPARSAHDFAASGHSRRQPLHSTRSFECEGGGIGFSIHIGFGSQ